MRLRQTLHTLNSISYEDVRLKRTYRHNGEADDYSNLNNFKKFLERLSVIPIFKEDIEFIKNSEIYSTTLDTIRAPLTTVHLKAEYLYNAATSLRLALEAQLSPESKDSIIVKMPEELDMKSLVNDLSHIEKALSQVVSGSEIDGSVKVNSWEPGSLWLEIYLGTQAAVSLVGTIVWAATVINKKRQEVKIFEEHVNSLKIKNDSLNDLKDAQKKMLDAMVETEARSVENEVFGDENAERSERIKFAIKTFSELILKGAEMHPALSAPENVSNVFPNTNDPLSIESRTKLLKEENDAQQDA